ncbi:MULTISPECIES: hypothetical protein [unclassified Streptomyces]|uniref:hypothetical protein n=1 Tax=unclassified Streptomyces TaxID=2593676 RepID=UPI000C2783B3|nr:hypothetical protein [Streptomyces sp. CB02959]PJN34617.1 hypothetical protein CG747_38770 [Streptomyces sp. CB02959]
MTRTVHTVTLAAVTVALLGAATAPALAAAPHARPGLVQPFDRHAPITSAVTSAVAPQDRHTP